MLAYFYLRVFFGSCVSNSDKLHKEGKFITPLHPGCLLMYNVNTNSCWQVSVVRTDAKYSRLVVNGLKQVKGPYMASLKSTCSLGATSVGWTWREPPPPSGPVYSRKGCGALACFMVSRTFYVCWGCLCTGRERVKRVKSIVILNEVAEKKERSGYAGSEREAVWWTRWQSNQASYLGILVI